MGTPEHISEGQRVARLLPPRIANRDTAGDYQDEPLPYYDEEPPAEIIGWESRPPLSALDRLKARLLTATQMEDLPPPTWQISDVLVQDSLAALYGKPGGGKSFVALDWAACTATGTWWFGHEVVKGSVLYVAAEGAAGIGKRLRAWKKGQGFYGDIDGLHFLTVAPSFLDPVETEAVCQIAAELSPQLIVVDTLSRALAGGDENSSKDMGRVVLAADQLRVRTGACVVMLHHDTKAGETMRGHSALLGALDTQIECKGGDGRLTIRNLKQKDSAEFGDMHFALIEVDDSCVLAAATGGATITVGAVETLRVLAEIEVPGGVSASNWKASVASADATFYRHRSSLLTEGWIENVGTDTRPRYAVTPAGRSAFQEDIQQAA